MKSRIFIILLACLLSFSACRSTSDDGIRPDDTPSTEALQSEIRTASVRLLTLEGRRYTYTGDAEDISAEGNVLTLQKSGTYRLSGTLTDGRLRIAVPHGTVHLLLDGVAISSSLGAPLAIDAACVIIETAEGSVNRLTDSSASPAEPNEDICPTACIRADCRLVLQGSGTLIVSGRRENALSCSQSVSVESGSLTLSAPDIGLWVRDRLLLSGGSVTVTAATRGIVSPQGEAVEGLVAVSGGRLTVTATELAVFAGREIRISGGSGDLSAPKLYDSQSVVLLSPDFPSK